MKNLLLIILLISFSAAISQNKINEKPDSLDFNSGLIYGKDHLFALSAPTGWVLDNSSGVSQGLHAVFYPRGGSWEHSPSVMYANTASKKVKGNETLEKLITFDVSRYKQNYVSLKIVNAPDIQLTDHKSAVVKYFYYSNSEAVAYIDEENIVVLIVLSSTSQPEFEKSLTPFSQLVKSYRFLTSEVHIEE